MKIAVFLDHDVIVRHFVQSGAFAELAKKHELTFVFPEIENKRVRFDPSALDLHGARVVRVPQNRQRHYLWSTLLFVDYLRWRPGAIYAAHRKKLRRQFPAKAILLYTLLGIPGVFHVFRAAMRSLIEGEPNRALEAFLDEARCDAILHPSILEGIYINDLIETTKRRAVPLVVVMNSWDNPSSKRAISGTPDWMLVWGEQTWRHAVEFTNMPPDRTVRFGVAQFDVFRNAPRITREEFCRRNSIDPKLRVLLYAGSSKTTDEFAHVRRLEDAVESGVLADTVVVYRPHPWGDGGRDGHRFVEHPWKHVRLESTMTSYLDAVARGDKSMSFPDYRDTHDVLSSVDAVVSPLSTIIVEAAIHGKPVMCYLPLGEIEATHLQMVAHMPHFKDMIENADVIVARDESELVAGAVALAGKIDDPQTAARMVELSRFYAMPFEDSYPRRLEAFVASLAKRGRE